MNDSKSGAAEATKQLDQTEEKKAAVATEEKPCGLSVKTSLCAGKPIVGLELP
jgi:hypothetical protein